MLKKKNYLRAIKFIHKHTHTCRS